MTAYPTSLFLAVGDTMTASGGDYIPSSGDYLNLLDPNAILCTEGGLIIPTSKEPADQKKAGAVIRIRSVRSQPIKIITLHLLLRAGGSDSTTWRRLWANIEHKLEQAAAASGPFGHGTNVCLLVRFSTGGFASSLGANFTAFDVLGGVCTQNDLLTNSGQAYGMTLELRCLMHGRLTAQRYPLTTNTFSALAQQTPTLYLGPSSSGSIGGHLGALAQLHIDDTSSAGHINRVRVGRRSVPGASGGMASTDWQGVVPVAAALGSASYLSSGAGTYGQVGTNFASQALTDSNWHDLAAVYIPGTNPLHQAGIYDCYLRVREAATIATEPSITSLALGTLASNIVLIPDTYNVRVAYNDGTIASAASPIATITVPYISWPPNLAYESFETGDTSAGLELTDTSHGSGKLAVETQAALAGAYGLHVSLYANFPKDSSATLYPQPAQVYRRPISVFDTTNRLGCGCWMQMDSGLSVSYAYLMLLSIGSSTLLGANFPGAGTDGISGAPVPMGVLMGGALCAIAVDFNNHIGVLTWNGNSSHTFTTFMNGINPVTPSMLVGQKVYLSLDIASAQIAQSTAFGISASLLAETFQSVISPTSSGIGSWTFFTGGVTADYVDMGARLSDGAAMVNIFFDDLWVQQQGGGRPGYPLPGNGIVCASSDGGSNRDLYIQRQSDLWYLAAHPVAQNHVINSQDAFGVAAAPPEQAIPQASLIRPKVGIKGSADFLTGTPVPTALQGNLWHLLYLGTYALPPVQRFEGLNPTFGSGAGDFPFELDVSAQSGSGTTSNTVQIDALFLVPHEEPQIVAEYPALNNTTLLSEWVLDSRRDGRAGAVLRDPLSTGWATVVAQAETIGHMELGSGNQILLFLVEREGGIHDAAGTAFGVAVRWQPLVDFVDDNPTAY